MKARKWIEVNLQEKYIIFEDKPKEKVPIVDGKISLDMKNKKLNVQVQL